MVLQSNRNGRAGKRGFATFVIISLAVLPLGWAKGQAPDKSDTAWNSFLQNPNSEEAFRKVFPVASKQADKEFGEWYLSGLYIGDAKDGQKFFVVQTYDGTEATGFLLGFLLVTDSRGQTLGMIERQRIHGASSFERVQAVPKAALRQKQTAARLPDLTGDGVSDIMTERWKTQQDANTHHVSYAIYRNEGASVHQVVSVEFESTSDQASVHWDAWHLTPLDGPTDGFAIMGRLFGPVGEARARELAEMLPISLQNRSMRFVVSFDPTQSPRVLATYEWSEDKQSFVGPRKGPGNIWRVLDAPERSPKTSDK